MIDRWLIVFARAPAVGIGKTRLAADCGRTAAWRIGRAMTARVLRSVQDPRWRVALAIAPDRAVQRLAPGVWPPHLPKIAQGAGGLGEKLERALRRRGPTLVIGTDAPDVRASDVWAGFQALRSAEYVYGPAVDGGFWLIGAGRSLRAGSLSGVRWSTEHALADVQAQLSGSSRLLRTLADVDTGADWRAREGRV